MILPANLICTVGTSLFSSNLNRLDPAEQFRILQTDKGNCDPGGGGYALLSDSDRLKNTLEDIKAAHARRDGGRIAALFTRLPPHIRLLGAEINSIEAMIRKGFLPEDRARLILLVSDTADGGAIGRILKDYFLHKACLISFQQCEVETVDGLQDKKPLVFQKAGLTNLARLLGKHYRKWGGAIAINATGGYKAQIALSVAFGQAIGSPVYYKHEHFDQIIRFPQIPFALDLSLVRDHLKVWADLAEPDAAFTDQEIERLMGGDLQFREVMQPLLEQIEDEGMRFFCLSALGMVYWEAFRSLEPLAVLNPAAVKDRKGCRFRDDHYPIGFKEYVDRFFNAQPEFVSGCHSLPYDRQPSIRNRFRVQGKKIIGEYQDSDGFGARFEVLTSARNELERAWLVEKFNQWMEVH